MSNQHRLNRLVQLNAIADRALEINFSRYGDEDESNLGRNLAIGAGVTGVAGTGALYARGSKVWNDWGGSERGPGAMNRVRSVGDKIKAGYRALPGDYESLKSQAGKVAGDYREARLGEWGSGAKVGQRLGRGRVAAAGGAVAKLIARLRGK
jgi:hypothetical protein